MCFLRMYFNVKFIVICFTDTLTRLYTFVAISLVLSTVVFFFVLGVVLYIWIKYRRQAADENSKLKKKMQSVKVGIL